MANYIVRKKGIFGTLYIDTPAYNFYPSTTREIERAFKFKDYEKATTFARKLFGEVVEVEEETPIKIGEAKTEIEEKAATKE